MLNICQQRHVVARAVVTGVFVVIFNVLDNLLAAVVAHYNSLLIFVFTLPIQLIFIVAFNKSTTIQKKQQTTKSEKRVIVPSSNVRGMIEIFSMFGYTIDNDFMPVLPDFRFDNIHF